MKTAVEWLFEKLWDEPKDKFTWYALRAQAKQMEKEQIIDAYEAAFENPLAGYAESYYNMNYNQNK